jgi:hypothetical protein
MKGILVIIFFFCALCITGISAYSVSGNQLLGPNGEGVRIRGMCRPSLEWQADGQYLSLSDYTLMKNDWKANAVRLSLNQVFWATDATGGSDLKYADRVYQQVEWIKGLGMGVILDLHWSEGTGNGVGQQCMADQNSITFWSQVANTYKNDPWIMFELYNEPHDVSWEVWRNGGSGCGFNVAGMQQLYNAVRATGAENVVIVNGLNYAYDLSQLNSYLLEGTNIMYGTHPYNFPGKLEGDWDSGFGFVPPNFPLIATEFGQYCATTNYVADLIQYFETKGIHWTAWAWWAQDCQFPSVIADWNGTPFGAVGMAVKNAMVSASSGTSPAPAPTDAPQPTVPSQPTEQPSQPTEQPQPQPTSNAGGSSSVTVKVHEGSNAWWLAVTSVEVAGHTVDSVQLKDSSEGADWKEFPFSWAFVYQAAPSQFVLPLSIKIITTDHQYAIVNNIITDFGASTKSDTVDFQPI